MGPAPPGGTIGTVAAVGFPALDGDSCLMADLRSLRPAP